ncbi:unnamed protein product [Sphagnum balticum]
MRMFIYVFSMFLMHMYLPVSTMHSTVKQLYTDHDLLRVAFASEEDRTARRHLVRVAHAFAARLDQSHPAPNRLPVFCFRHTSVTMASKVDCNTSSKRSSARSENGVRKMFVLLAPSAMRHSFTGEKKMKQSQQGPSTGKRFEAEGGMDKPGSNKLLSNKKSRTKQSGGTGVYTRSNQTDVGDNANTQTGTSADTGARQQGQRNRTDTGQITGFGHPVHDAVLVDTWWTFVCSP